jgi:hypothetical protein
MTRPLTRILQLLSATLALAAVASGASAPQSPAPSPVPFSTGLTSAQAAACGLGRLTDAERAVLDTAVARELALARQGGVRGFSTPFSERQPPADRARSGLDRLTDAERHALDEAVAGAMASTYLQPLSPRTLLGGPLETVAPPSPLHGSMTLMYGWGSGGRSAYGASMEVTYLDPKDRFSATVVYSTTRGDLFIDDDPAISMRTGAPGRRRR